MSPLFQLIKEKNERLNSIPLKMQSAAEKSQKAALNDILYQLGKLELKDGQIKINNANLKIINQISEDLKGSLLSKEYLQAVKSFASQFDAQAKLNDKIIKAGVGEIENPLAARSYITNAKKTAISALSGDAFGAQITGPVSDYLQAAVVNGSSINDTIDGLRNLMEGDKKIDGKLLKYVKTITSDSFAVADRSYTSIVSDFLDAEWFYYAGSEVDNTRCFCHQRVGNYYHYEEIEAWGNGEDLGECNLGEGKWAGMIPGTNAKTIYSYLGGYGCMHSLMPVSEAIVPDSDIQRAIDKGYIN
jgi:hypothetical protein